MASLKLSRYEAEEGDLPDVCMRCGAEATEAKRRRFTSHPLWVYVLLPFGWVPYAIVAIILTEHIRCYTLFCPRHKDYFLIRSLFVWGALLLILAFIVGGLILAGSMSGRGRGTAGDFLFGFWCIGTVVLLLCWLISIPISQVMEIHPAEATQRHLVLKRVSPEFVDAVYEHRANRKKQEQKDDDRRGSGQRRSSPHYRKGDDRYISDP